MELGGFDCGEPPLNDYLAHHALDSQASHFAVTHVVVLAEQVVGFVTLAASQITAAEFGRSDKPRYPLPTLTVARLAIDRRFQGNAIGTALLRFSFLEAIRMSDDFGCVGVRVTAKPDAVGFYERFGFVRVIPAGRPTSESRTIPMFLPLNQIVDAIR